ncbi:helix-turn-helix domain-containing protein [Aeromonas salmonicida subsp. salmonicida]|uniref:Phage DNA-binding protein n=2 Tax=Aeromonas TaxID=642 RepID=A0A0A7KW57_AERSS|nr:MULTISPECIES: XRE family transcriptional regulator [Aeromonas]AIZ49706.1 phage DNA-binding protein [Aeromonas salmonicida subsp. salmonicida]ELI6443085.1 helix-turn-helix domain-containing protein [Aeromonas salmonicida subsp. salmonicida]ELY1972538.1 helix-turn-helix domain-containing protein [Aeromonas salmonicida]ELY2003722.1 helix-turn-helix domain-containing protein [Aeromonas salmonicida]MCR4454217.1 LexA family transcriptional regulator [Aeromonas salmonicida]
MFVESNDMVKLMSSFNERLQQLMNEKGLKPADLARKTGLSKPTLSAIIRGTTTDPRISSVLGISRVLGCDPVWLFVGKNSAEYASSAEISKVPIWELKDMVSHPSDAIPLIDTGRHLVVEDGGHLCAVVAANDDLAGSGIHSGDFIVIDMSPEQRKLETGDIALVRHGDKALLLRAKSALDGMNLVVDDPHFGFLKASEALVLGKMIELRRA